jgi:hypothetical protein
LVALVFWAGFFARSLEESDPEGARLPPLPMSTFKTHYAQEGLTVSKWARRVVKQLALVRQSRRRSDVIVQRLL